jgi:thioredoxin 1
MRQRSLACKGVEFLKKCFTARAPLLWLASAQQQRRRWFGPAAQLSGRVLNMLLCQKHLPKTLWIACPAHDGQSSLDASRIPISNRFSGTRPPPTSTVCLTSYAMLQPLVVIEFKAMWCGPCKIIAPAFEKMQEEFPSVVFTKVDVDTNEETQAECNVQHLPTFQFYKGGQKVGEVFGVEEPKIRVRSPLPCNRAL